MRLWICIPLLCFVVVICCGCASCTPAATARLYGDEAFTLDRTAWPKREAVNNQQHNPDELIETYPVSDYQLFYHGIPVPKRYLGAYGEGVLYQIMTTEPPAMRDAKAGKLRLLFESNVLIKGLHNKEYREKHPDNPPFFAFELPTITDFVFYESLRSSTRGIIVHLSSLVRHSRQERAVIGELRQRGWAVIGTSLPRSFEAMHMNKPFAPIQLTTQKSLDATGWKLARKVDNRLAEWAYGVEAMLLYLAEQRPDIPQSVLVGLGCSAGALGLPATASRLDNRFVAAVFVGGGADVLSVIRKTSLPEAGLAIEWTREKYPDKNQWRMITRRYLHYSALDPYHTAVALRHVPVLMVHAYFDRIVPADTGDLLYERLGRPERWTYPLGHLGLFWLLPTKAGYIADWIEQAVAEDIPAE